MTVTIPPDADGLIPVPGVPVRGRGVPVRWRAGRRTAVLAAAVLALTAGVDMAAGHLRGDTVLRTYAVAVRVPDGVTSVQVQAGQDEPQCVSLPGGAGEYHVLVDQPAQPDQLALAAYQASGCPRAALVDLTFVRLAEQPAVLADLTGHRVPAA